MLNLAGRRVLVTGASLGIGRAIASLFSSRGARLALHFSGAVDDAMGHAGAGDALVKELVDADHEAHAIDLNLGDANAGPRVVEQAMQGLGGLDVLVLCASVQVRQPFDEVDAGSLSLQSRVNFEASMGLLKAALPPMQLQKSGRIISIGSINQVRPHAELMAYAALKAAQHTLILGIARQHAGDGITANTVSPGLVATPRNEWRRQDPSVWDGIQKQANPMQRAGTAEEVAQVVGLLAADAGAFITGADIPIDGGARL